MELWGTKPAEQPSPAPGLPPAPPGEPDPRPEPGPCPTDTAPSRPALILRSWPPGAAMLQIWTS